MKLTKVAKATIAAAAGMAMLVPLAACGNTSAGGGKTKLTVFTWDNDEVMKPYIKAFEAKYPDITVDQSSAPSNGDKDQILNTRISGGQAPDVFYFGNAKNDLKVAKNLVLDITDESFVDKMGDGSRAYMSKDDRVYGVTSTAWESGIVYNKDLLAKVGVETIPETWDEFIDLCKKIKNELGITPFQEHLDETPHLVAACMGGHYAAKNNELGDMSIIDGDTTFQKEYQSCLTQWMRLYNEGIESRDSVGVGGEQALQEFVNGNAAMIITGAWDFTKLNESGVNWGMDLVPTFKGGESRYGAGADSPGYAIYAKVKGEKLDAAKKWLEFMLSDEALKISADSGNIVTVKGFEQKVDSHYQTVYEKGLKEGRYYLPNQNFGLHGTAIDTEATSQYQLLVQGQITPEQWGKNMDAKVKSLS